MPVAEKSAPVKQTEDKPVARTREPLWSRNGLLIMIGAWVVTLGLGIAGVALFMGAPTATGATVQSDGRGAGRAFGLIERVQVSVPDENNEMRTISFNILLDFGEGDDKSRAELEQGNFKAGLSYQAEELLRAYSVRQVTERAFAREYGAQLRRHLNELYSRDGRPWIREVLIQNLAVSN